MAVGRMVFEKNSRICGCVGLGSAAGLVVLVVVVR